MIMTGKPSRTLKVLRHMASTGGPDAGQLRQGMLSSLHSASPDQGLQLSWAVAHPLDRAQKGNKAAYRPP